MPRLPLQAVLVVASVLAIGVSQPVASADPLPTTSLVRSRQERVERLGRMVTASAHSVRPLAFEISRRGGLGAWAWHSGRIEVTPALVDALDDDELAAALAHEAAHLTAEDVAADRPAALAASDSEAIERAADRRGCSLLIEAGVPAEAMVRMLRKVATGLREPQLLAGRIAEASLACGAVHVDAHDPG